VLSLMLVLMICMQLVATQVFADVQCATMPCSIPYQISLKSFHRSRPGMVKAVS
jgi:hypothetical protein